MIVLKLLQPQLPQTFLVPEQVPVKLQLLAANTPIPYTNSFGNQPFGLGAFGGIYSSVPAVNNQAVPQHFTIAEGIHTVLRLLDVMKVTTTQTSLGNQPFGLGAFGGITTVPMATTSSPFPATYS